MQQRKNRQSQVKEEQIREDVASPESIQPSEAAVKPEKEKKKKKAKSTSTATSAPISAPDEDTNADIPQDDLAEKEPTPTSKATKKAKPQLPKDDSPEPAEDFTSIYLRKVTANLADDLDKVREASDFTNRSLPLLINALKQGESLYSAEERRRVVAAAGGS